jgi:hypothetical protein
MILGNSAALDVVDSLVGVAVPHAPALRLRALGDT